MQRRGGFYLKVIGKCETARERIREFNIKAEGVNDKSER